jgi:PTH1 family peptidyl-tRNA hydrolase
LNDLLVIDDDANLPIGRLRVRARGSHGGHNGLRSIIESVGGEEFARLRIGVQPDRPVIDMARYVLSSPPPVDRARLEEMVDVAADAAECWIAEGTEAAAGRFNGFRQAAAG